MRSPAAFLAVRAMPTEAVTAAQRSVSSEATHCSELWPVPASRKLPQERLPCMASIAWKIGDDVGEEVGFICLTGWLEIEEG